MQKVPLTRVRTTPGRQTLQEGPKHFPDCRLILLALPFPFFRSMHKTHTSEVSAPAFLTLALKTVLKVLGCYSTDKNLFYNIFLITPFVVQA